MGQMIDGRWSREDQLTVGGAFQRKPSSFRHWITPDGAPGPTGSGGFRAEPGRYHLYVSYACPWAHRTLIYRALKGLEPMIGLSVTHWLMGEDGWSFAPDPDGVVGDALGGASFLHEIYAKADPAYTGRVTVPVLWDKASSTIVNNESEDIIRMFNAAFDGCGARPGGYRPEPLSEEIDRLNGFIYERVNNGVYRAGFARTQEAYEEAVRPLFAALEEIDARLASRRFLLGAQPLEPDWRLLPTLLRFDLAYHGHFKCNLRLLADFAHLWDYACDLYRWPGIAATCRFDHAKRHYYESHRHINPTGIVPAGPLLDLERGRERARLG